MNFSEYELVRTSCYFRIDQSTCSTSYTPGVGSGTRVYGPIFYFLIADVFTQNIFMGKSYGFGAMLGVTKVEQSNSFFSIVVGKTSNADSTNIFQINCGVFMIKITWSDVCVFLLHYIQKSHKFESLSKI